MWVDTSSLFRGGEIYLRDEPVQPPPVLPGSTEKGSARVPELKFSYRGSTGYTIRRACLRCGHSTTEKREQKAQ